MANWRVVAILSCENVATFAEYYKVGDYHMVQTKAALCWCEFKYYVCARIAMCVSACHTPLSPPISQYARPLYSYCPHIIKMETRLQFSSLPHSDMCGSANSFCRRFFFFVTLDSNETCANNVPDGIV